MTERELAEKAGIHRSLVGRKRRAGKTDEQILKEAKQRKATETAKNPKRSKQADNDGLSNGHKANRKHASPVNCEIPIEGESFADAQARKERALASLREVELAVRRGELVLKAEVQDIAFQHARAERDAQFNWLSKICPVIGNELGVDPGELHRRLDLELRQFLAVEVKPFSLEARRK